MTTMHPRSLSELSPSVAHHDMAMLAHDVRGALHGVVGGVAMLEGADLAPQVREQVERIGAAGKSLADLLCRFLGEETRMCAAGRADRVDLQRFLQHVSRRWGGEAMERNVRFRIVASEEVPASLQANVVSLGRVLGNLIGNAVRYARPWDVRLNVRGGDDGGVIFEVLDDGPGFPREVLERAARPYPETDPFQRGDHGLGLEIARTLCEEMGGVFDLSNRPSGGGRVALTFPGVLCDGRSDQPAAPAQLERVDLGGLRVLLAEDNLTNQMVAVQMLGALNAVVTLTSDGVETLERFETDDFDMVVVDIEMPRMSGLDVIRTIRGRGDARANVPIVALTAYALREHRERIAAVGANGLISKPITSVEAFGNALREHIAATRAPAEPAAPAQAGAQAPVADLAVFDALCAAIGAGMMAELLDKVVADLLEARSVLARAESPLDRKAIQSASHILISVAGAIGANRLQSCARSLNVAAHGEYASAWSDDLRRCIAEIDAAVAFAHGRRPVE